MEKKKLAITAVVTTSLTVSTILGSLPNVYALENTNIKQNKVEKNIEENTLFTDVKDVANAQLSGECGATVNDKVNWKLKQNNSDNSNPTYTLVISGKGKMEDFKYVSGAMGTAVTNSPWVNHVSKITGLAVEEGVTLGERAFQGLFYVTELKLDKNITQIPKYAFADLISLENITIPENVTFIGEGAFRATKISEIIVPSSVTSYGTYIFRGCTSLTKVNLPNNLKELPNGMFSECSSLKNINLPEITSIGDKAFYKSGLTKIKLPTSTRIIGGWAFEECKNLEKVDFSNTNIEKISEAAFKNSSNIKEINLPDTLTSIGAEAFLGTAITNIQFPKNVNTLGVKVVKDCPNLVYMSLYTEPLKKKDGEEAGDYAKRIADDCFDYIGNQKNIIYFIGDELPKVFDYGYLANRIDRTKTAIALTNEGIFTSDIEFKNEELEIPTRNGYKFDGWYKLGQHGNIGDIADKNAEEKYIIKYDGNNNYPIYSAKWTEKQETTISFKDDTLNLNKKYDGKAISLSKDNCTVTPDNANVTFSYQIKEENTWKDIDSVPTNAGTYRVKAVVKENDTYKGAETDWKEFTISKADLTEDSYKDKIPTNLTATIGQTLADIKLPKGFTWKDSSTSVGKVGTHEFDAIFTPTDTLNYNSVDVKINVKVEQRYVPSVPSNPTEKPDEKPGIGVKVDVVDKIAGATRYDTSVRISKKVFSTKAEKVYLVSGEKFPDALSSAALTGKGDGPILLINDKNIDKILFEIDRLDAKEIVFVGGNSISDANEAKIRKFAKENSSVVKSIIGKDRYETAVKVAEETIAKYGNKGKVIVADGRNYPDAVSIASYAAKEGIPVILVNGNKVPDVVKNFLNKYKISNAIIVGGDKAVGKDVEKLFKSVDRVAGADRYDTSKKIAEKFFNGSKNVFVASGESFADSLSVSYYAGAKNAPILLTKANSLDNDTKEYLEKNKNKDYIIVGGDKAVNPDLFK